jgi:phosphoglucosamine mutase
VPVGKLFGTDGVRGLANADLTPELALALGRAAVGVLRDAAPSPGRPAVVVGRDPRASGALLESALVAGILSAGGDVLAAGVVPTPAVAFLTRHYGAAAGAVISASHNAMPDNGIKFFGPEGFKLPDAVEDRIEAALGAADQGAPRPVAGEVGRLRRTANDAVEAYLAHLLEGIPDLGGLEVVVDCANGAATAIAPEAYRRAGARVTAVADAPDGHNINDGVGSTHPEHVQAAVAGAGAAVGLTHDGDADRLLAVDERGQLVDGDVILAVTAVDERDRGGLPTNTVVTTVMTNLGFRQAMADHGIQVQQTAVGDRYVLEAMLAGGHTLGGEQSGHLIFLDRATTGDGLLTGLRLLAVVARSGRPLSELARVMRRLPQVLVNVRVADRRGLDGASSVWNAVAAEEARLGDRGRVLVRPSGTEPLVRVMVEAETEQEARSTADRLAAVVAGELG